jgi:hypothetical protein
LSSWVRSKTVCDQEYVRAFRFFGILSHWKIGNSVEQKFRSHKVMVSRPKDLRWDRSANRTHCFSLTKHLTKLLSPQSPN